MFKSVFFCSEKTRTSLEIPPTCDDYVDSRKRIRLVTTVDLTSSQSSEQNQFPGEIGLSLNSISNKIQHLDTQSLFGFLTEITFELSHRFNQNTK